MISDKNLCLGKGIRNIGNGNYVGRNLFPTSIFFSVSIYLND